MNKILYKKRSGIEWTGKTWNPTTGCSKVESCADCMNCYAEKIAISLFKQGVPSCIILNKVSHQIL